MGIYYYLKRMIVTFIMIAIFIHRGHCAKLRIDYDDLDKVLKM